nr:hypothetical protein HK105_001473 [Polyrhizophydium stewartii]
MATLRPGAPSPVDALISGVLIEERAGLDAFIADPFLVKWTFANDLGLVFVVAHQKVLTLPYVDELLDAVKSTFCGRFRDLVGDVANIDAYAEFDDVFDSVLELIEDKHRESRKAKAPRPFNESRKFQNTLEASRIKPGKGGSAAAAASAAGGGGTADPGSSSPETGSLAAKLERLGQRGVGPRGKRGGAAGKPKAAAAAAGSVLDSADAAAGGSPTQAKRGKQMRAWDGTGAAVNADPSQKLDFSDTTAADASAPTALIGDGLGKRAADGTYDALELEDPADDGGDDDDDNDGAVPAEQKKKPATGLMGYFERWTAGKILAEADLEPAMLKMKEHLVGKNVAADIATHLCESVTSGLVGTKIGPFQSLSSAIREQMETALSRILTPSSSTDVLRDIKRVNQTGRPYTITFVGVNGVGKSTNLSKVCFWLLQNKKRVLIAACDTFRSGAVEQLRVHARNLKALEEGAVVDLFDKGYGKDPAGIAKEAIAHATAERYDVVLVDTAGRMQDNEPLMRALAKLIAVNSPDKIVFVGEALVGNEAVDQLSKFNQALRDFSGLRDPRQIDGMILTKFDTIDDKVGAALSMTYTTGKPILFVGTGQTYTDLRKMNVRTIVNALLK